MALSYFQGNAGVKNAARRLNVYGHEVLPKDPRAHLHPRWEKRYAEQIEEVGTSPELSGSEAQEPVPDKAGPVKHHRNWKDERKARQASKAVNRALAFVPPEYRPK